MSEGNRFLGLTTEEINAVLRAEMVHTPSAAEQKIMFHNTHTFTVQTPALEVVRLAPDAILPTKAHVGDLGYDLYALEDVVLEPGKVTKVKTGIACNFPVGYGALLRDRSSVATKKEVFVVAGVIDQGYTGEIIVAFYNPGTPVNRVEYSRGTVMVTDVQVSLDGPIFFNKGDKIAQMILTPVINFNVREVERVNDTERAGNGFGSSGDKAVTGNSGT